MLVYKICIYLCICQQPNNSDLVGEVGFQNCEDTMETENSGKELVHYREP